MISLDFLCETTEWFICILTRSRDALHCLVKCFDLYIDMTLTSTEGRKIGQCRCKYGTDTNSQNKTWCTKRGLWCKQQRCKTWKHRPHCQTCCKLRHDAKLIGSVPYLWSTLQWSTSVDFKTYWLKTSANYSNKNWPHFFFVERKKNLFEKNFSYTFFLLYNLTADFLHVSQSGTKMCVRV